MTYYFKNDLKQRNVFGCFPKKFVRRDVADLRACKFGGIFRLHFDMAELLHSENTTHQKRRRHRLHDRNGGAVPQFKRPL